MKRLVNRFFKDESILSNEYSFIICAAIIVVGVYFRLLATGASFGVDEVRIANIVSNSNGFLKYCDYPACHRPLLYLMVSDLLASVYNNELVLRLTSIVPGILLLLIVFNLSKILFRKQFFVILAVFFISMNPYLINLSKEFKPYMLESFLCCYLVYLVFCWQRKPSDKLAYVYAGLIIPVGLLAYPIIFVVPCASFVLWMSMRAKGMGRLQIILAFSTLMSIAIFGTQYFLVSGHTPGKAFVSWDKFFYHGGGGASMFTWGAQHLVTMVYELVPAKIFTDRFHYLNAIVGGWFLVGFLFALINYVVSRKWQMAVLLLGPVALSFIAAFLGKWPIGNIRTSGYLIVFLTLNALLGWNFILSSVKNKNVVFAIGVIVLVIQFPYEVHYYSQRRGVYWAPNEDFVGAVEELLGKDIDDDLYGRIPVIFSDSSRYAYEYYSNYHVSKASKYVNYFSDRTVTFLDWGGEDNVFTQLSDEIVGKGKSWVLFWHNNPAEKSALQELINEQKVKILYEKHFAASPIFLVSSL